MDADEKLRTAIIDTLGARAVDPADLVAPVSTSGPPAGLDEINELIEHDPSFARTSLGDFYTPAMVEGTAWTVFVDAEDAGDDVLALQPWLAPLIWWLVTEPPTVRVGDGPAVDGEVSDRWADDAQIDVLTGPPGWLSPLAGGWATLIVESGSLRLAPCPKPTDPDPEQVAALRAALQRAERPQEVDLIDRDEPVELRFASTDRVINEVLAAARPAFLAKPIAPLPALYEEAGISRDGDLLAAEGFDWDTLHSWQGRNRLAMHHGLEHHEADAVVVLAGAAMSVIDGLEDALGSTDEERAGATGFLGSLLASGPVAGAFWDEIVDRGLAPNIGRLVDAIQADSDYGRDDDLDVGDVAVGMRWLAARAAAQTGDHERAEELLGAIGPYGDHGPTLLDLATLAADRGDLDVALQLVTRATASPGSGRRHDELTEALQAEIEGYRSIRPRAMAKRNDPCPCESGRKYKVCHLGRELLPLEVRAAWLNDKAARYVRFNHPDKPFTIAVEIVGESPTQLAQWEYSPLVNDLVLHEGGVFAEFVRNRGGLLPDDEAALVEPWMATDRGVFEVVGIDDQSIDLHDVNRNTDVTVTNVNPSMRLRRGLILLGRPLPVGDTHRALNGLVELPGALARSMSEALEDGSPFSVAAVLAQLVDPIR